MRIAIVRVPELGWEPGPRRIHGNRPKAMTVQLVSHEVAAVSWLGWADRCSGPYSSYREREASHPRSTARELSL